MLSVAVPLFAATVWVLIGGLVSALVPGLFLCLSFHNRPSGGCKATPEKENAKSVPDDEASRSAVGLQFGVDAVLKRKDKAQQTEEDDVLASDRGARGIPAFLGALDAPRGCHRRAASHATLLPDAHGQHDRPCSRSHPIPRELDLLMDEPPSLTVVLDLDETLVRSCEQDDVPVHLEFAAMMGKLVKLDVECVGSSQSYGRVASFLRPGLFEFLEKVSKLADVYIFTAGDPDYARPLVQLLDREGKFFLGSYYRETTVATTVHDHVKDLTRLGVDLTRTVLVDNNPYSFLLQPDNGILCEPFYGEPTDCHLLDVVLPTLQLLARVPDVRPILNQRYNLAGWCQTLEDWCC